MKKRNESAKHIIEYLLASGFNYSLSPRGQSRLARKNEIDCRVVVVTDNGLLGLMENAMTNQIQAIVDLPHLKSVLELK